MKQLIKATLKDLEFTAHFISSEFNDISVDIFITQRITIRDKITKKEISFDFIRRQGHHLALIKDKKELSFVIREIAMDFQSLNKNEYDYKCFCEDIFRSEHLEIIMLNKKFEKEYTNYVTALNSLNDFYKDDIERMRDTVESKLELV